MVILLIKRNNSAHIILIPDSSMIMVQKKDPSLSYDVKKNNNCKKTYRNHVVRDNISIPLQIH